MIHGLLRSALVTLAFVICAMRDAPAQSTAEFPEFTPDEVFSALVKVAPEAEARRIVQGLFTNDLSELGFPPNEPLPSFPVSGIAFLSEDMLILLSLGAEATRRKVDAYRRELLGGREPSTEEERTWEARRELVRTELERGRPPHQEPDSGK